MSTAQLLKHVRSLSSSERKKFMRSVQAMDNAPPKHKKRKPAEGKVKWPDVEARARKIFGNRVFPNLVQVERDERGF